MIGKSENQNQLYFLQPLHKDFINLKHELVLLNDRIAWSSFRHELATYYSKRELDLQ